MGFFDLFKGGKDKPVEEKRANAAAKWADVARDKRAQNYDRQEALVALAGMETAEAAAALLRRFDFHMDPSITDQEEKQIAFEGIIAAGENAVEPVRAYAVKAPSLAWPMKILTELLEEDTYVEELVSWLAKWDVEYAKFVDPKIQLLVALEDHKSPLIRAAVEPFLEDMNETARFHAAATTFAQNDPEAILPLIHALCEEESFRVKNKIADGFLSRGWVIPDEQREAVRKVLPPGYTIDGEGKLRKHAS